MINSKQRYNQVPEMFINVRVGLLDEFLVLQFFLFYFEESEGEPGRSQFELLKKVFHLCFHTVQTVLNNAQPELQWFIPSELS